MKVRRRIRRKKGSNRLFVMIFAVVFSVGSISFLKSDFFLVRSVFVEGLQTLYPGEILEAAPVRPGFHQFSFSSAEVKREIMDRFMRIKDITVSRSLPSNVTIAVVERQADMLIFYDGKYYEVDGEGFAFSENSYIADKPALIISGLRDIEIAAGKQFDFYQTSSAQTCYEVVKQLKATGIYEKTSELLVETDAYYIYTTNANIIKFVQLKAFTSNEEFVGKFLNYDERQIMVELIEGRSPVYRTISVD